jgi:16S rRNA (guanine(966)-N(2))-methyltransferase RsmD
MKIIAGTFKNRSILSPKGEKTRPTSSRLRETLFNICQQYIEGTVFLDLFAGSGAMGFEALSRGASFVTFVDNDRNAIQSIKKNIEMLGVKECTAVVQGDVLQALERFQRQEKRFDIIYADPPYEDRYSGLLLKEMDRSNLLNEGGTFFLEESSKIRLDVDSLTRLKMANKRVSGRSVLFEFGY